MTPPCETVGWKRGRVYGALGENYTALLRRILVGHQNQETTLTADFSGLKRPKQPMPESVRQMLKERGLMRAYQRRPAYQQNDYLGWINQAKRQETKLKRLTQMLDEPEAGGIYMGMRHPVSENK